MKPIVKKLFGRILTLTPCTLGPRLTALLKDPKFPEGYEGTWLYRHISHGDWVPIAHVRETFFAAGYLPSMAALALLLEDYPEAFACDMALAEKDKAQDTLHTYQLIFREIGRAYESLGRFYVWRAHWDNGQDTQRAVKEEMKTAQAHFAKAKEYGYIEDVQLTMDRVLADFRTRFGVTQVEYRQRLRSFRSAGGSLHLEGGVKDLLAERDAEREGR